MIKITRKKSKSKFPELVNKLKALNNQQAQIGWFKDSGKHNLADMSYASLAYIHEFPANGKHKYRPVLGQIKPMPNEGRNKIFFKELLRKYVQPKASFKIEDVLDSIGRAWKQKGSYVFGNAQLLDSSWSSTPLVETGRLERSLGFKTTLNYTLRYA